MCVPGTEEAPLYGLQRITRCEEEEGCVVLALTSAFSSLPVSETLQDYSQLPYSEVLRLIYTMASNLFWFPRSRFPSLLPSGFYVEVNLVHYRGVSPVTAPSIRTICPLPPGDSRGWLATLSCPSRFCSQLQEWVPEVLQEVRVDFLFFYSSHVHPEGRTQFSRAHRGSIWSPRRFPLQTPSALCISRFLSNQLRKSPLTRTIRRLGSRVPA